MDEYREGDSDRRRTDGDRPGIETALVDDIVETATTHGAVATVSIESDDRTAVVSLDSNGATSGETDSTDRQNGDADSAAVTVEIRTNGTGKGRGQGGDTGGGDRQTELEAFASTVSHDLRNPLEVASLQLQLAREDHASEHLDGVKRAHDRIYGVVEELLTLAEQSANVRESEPVALRELAEECWQNVAAPDATLVVDVERTVRADRKRLQRLLENLLRNAVEHGSTNPDSQTRQDAVEHGSTSPDSQTRQDAVEHGSTSPDSQTRQDAVEHGTGVQVTIGELDDGFYVEDDGAGIPESERATVFEAGHSTAEDGTGFGLAIVQRVVDAHGWAVRVTDSATGGARFEVTGVEFDDT